MAMSGTQTTRHGLYGGARSPYGTFSGKTVTILVTGPGCFSSGEVYLGGFQKAQLTFPSFIEGEVYIPGFQEAQEVC